ncbi:chemotaxis protein CheX [Trichothermofontia sp.]
MSLLTTTQLDALQEMINIGVGRSASMLNQMLDVHVQLHVPQVKVLPAHVVEQELVQQLGLDPVATVQLGFSGSLSGLAQLVFPTASAAKLVSALSSEATDGPEDLDILRTGTLSEIGNIVLNGVMGMLSNLLHQHFQYSMPSYVEEEVHHLFSIRNVLKDDVVLLAQTRFLIEQLLVTGDIILLFNIGSFDTLLAVMTDSLELYDEQPA